MNESRQVRIGAVLSYILMILNMVCSLWITPLLIGNLGSAEHGLYKLTGSLSSSLIVLNLGIGETVQRYVSLYRAKHEERKIPNLMAMCLMVSVILSLLILLVGVAIILLFPTVYGNTLTPEQLSKANILLALSVVSVMVAVIQNLFSGLLAGYNRFIFSNGLKVVVLIVNTFCIWLAVTKGGDSVAIVLVALGSGLLVLIANWLYARNKIGVRIKYEFWDKSLFNEAGKYTLMMFLTSLASLAFTNVDTIVIGAFLETSIVSLYSVGLYFFNLFQQLSCGVSGVMLPTITMALNNDGGIKEAERIVIKAGRVQFLLLGAALAGIICTGREFIDLWLGENYKDAYILILILVIPSMFELCTNVCHSILNAMNKVAFRTYVNFASAAINAVLTVLLVKYWSYFGAAVATAFSYISCSLIAMNIYYYKVIKLDMLSIYKGIVSRIWLCILVPALVLLFMNRLIYGTWLSFIIKVAVFGVIYLLLLLFYGLGKDEAKQIPLLGSVAGKMPGLRSKTE